jgi:phosphatidylserine/phosphatidylglycerophosphate/cardiolipin synthase-like enzyme
LLELQHNCWRATTANRFAFIVDAEEYFKAVRAAMLNARQSIFLIGWDFDTRIRLEPAGDDEGPRNLGDFFLWLVGRTPSLNIRLLRWDTGAFKAIFRGNTLATVLRWKAHPRITLKLDGAHPIAASHHQKIVVIDDALAFCGGIDITSERWDRRDHSDADPGRRRPDGTAYGPWHDATSALDGPAAKAMGDLARERWHLATGEHLEPVACETDPWPHSLAPTFQRVGLGIARTVPKMEGQAEAHEIEQMYLDLIASAKRYIYAESQYFASRKIARAIAQRLSEPDGPEIVVINPKTAEGWLEPIAMDSARARLVEALERIDKRRRFRLYHPQTAGGEPIYVHAKVLIVDDHWLRVGSSNFNNRSMRLDTECDVIVAADQADSGSARATIANLRDDLLAEHLDVDTRTVTDALQQTGSLIDTIDKLRKPGRTLVPYAIPELNDTEAWLADNEILDPEGPDQIFEPLSRRGLFRKWHWKIGSRR